MTAQKTAISSHAEYRAEDYRFPRSRQDWLYVPLEHTPPVFIRWGKIAWGAIVLCALLCAAFSAPYLIVWVLG